MNISVCKIDDLNLNNVKEKINKYKSDLMIFVIDFSHNKEQIQHLLFFDKVAKSIKEFLIIFDIDFANCKLNNIIVFENKKYKIILPDFYIGGFVLRFFERKIAFVIGDNIYKKAYIKFVKNKNLKNIVHVDLYGEGVVLFQKNDNKNLNIISTKNNGFYALKF